MTRIPGIDLRRSKRLTKTNPIVRLNNPVVHGFYRKRGGQTKCPGNDRGRYGTLAPEKQPSTGSPGNNTSLSGTPNKTQPSAEDREYTLLERNTDQEYPKTVPLRNNISPGGGGNVEE